MPELPDVEIYRQDIERHALGRKVASAAVDADRMLRGVSASSLRDAVRGRTLDSARRVGKHLLLQLGEGGGWLHVHSGMTGRAVVYGEGDDAPAHARLRLDFEDGGHLAFTSQRKLGEFGLVDAPESFVRDRGLGPDPWEEGFDRKGFRDRLAGRRGSVKSALMNQEVLAGLGNVYVDEILFQAGLHPEIPVTDLDENTLGELHATMVQVLRTAVERGADPGRMPEGWLLPHREDGASCPRCDGTIVKARVSGRSTYRCDRHQEAPG
jgi:formamidopyrimidine-DNA glycosylase